MDKAELDKIKDTELIYGRDFDGYPIELKSIDTQTGEVIVQGQVFSVKQWPIGNDKIMLIFQITDFTDSINCQIFVSSEKMVELADVVKEGASLKIKGIVKTDIENELSVTSIQGIKRIKDFTRARVDTSSEKRVELHCHTKMSSMDGVLDVKDMIKKAYDWGHKAIAITDHGVVQAFPDAGRLFDSGKALEGSDFKVIYGMEGYLVDDINEAAASDGSFCLDREKTMPDGRVQKLRSYHAVILAMNETGRRNLYRLVSESHLKYFDGQPKIPKSLLNACRKGLLLGTACKSGELFSAIMENRTDKEIAQIVNEYDYLEIQPVANNEFMIYDDNYNIHTIEELRDINRRIVYLGEQFKKPVAATGDVHFLNPEDEICRRIVKDCSGFDNTDQQEPLYLRTTDEMLEEFSYLGEEKAREVVITNPNKIADMCERICPIRPGKFLPKIKNADRKLQEICEKRAHEIYGPELPAAVSMRLKQELDIIISSGYAGMYIIAGKLVKKSIEDGYLVGSRGSVGASFAAAMAGITEVNPLSPHYYCEKCHYHDFDSPKVKAYSGRTGFDMPDRICPKCGEKLKKDGFDIPFETFHGFAGEKEPDLDLNFDREYKGAAHRYAKELFGKEQIFRAGKVDVLTKKAAGDCVRRYFAKRGEIKKKSEIERLARRCMGVRCATGQQQEKIIVLPKGEDILSFTPVQYTEDDMTSDIITTHFDYRSIYHNLLSMDLLGNDDLTMLRMLRDMTGIDPYTVPLDSKEVMSLFQDISALEIETEDIRGCKLGTLGISDFGKDIVMQMLTCAKPKSFSDLIRIFGVVHGIKSWTGNAGDLIMDGTATISEVICTRDDIMNDLIRRGIDRELAYTIMEAVRKGKGLKEEWEKTMMEHNVPKWYIESCNKIYYLFPKAYAVAYVLMAWRIAYFKIFYPLEYYAAFFSIHAKSFDCELMCRGQERLEYYMQDYENRICSLSERERDKYGNMWIAEEMYARGFEFMPACSRRADAHRFQVIDGKLMPSLDTVRVVDDSGLLEDM